jgi:protoheme IX farnesyltransferase
LIKDFIALLKPRILTMQFVSLSLGYFMAPATGQPTFFKFLFALLGTAFSSGGAAALNHAWEWTLDAKMERTQHRPIPMGRISWQNASLIGAFLCILGVWILASKVNYLTAGLAALTVISYVLVYTPLKTRTWLNTYVGAIPGAILPLAGWAVATQTLSIGAFTLAGILAVWQIPHFFAIAWMYKEDYARGGFKMLPLYDPNGDRLIRQTWVSSVLLIAVSTLPVFFHLAGPVYFAGSILLGIWFLRLCLDFSKNRTREMARKVLKGSVLYLPLLLALMVLDHLF